MSLMSLVYVSRSLIKPENAASQISSLLFFARAKNKKIGISGSLVSTSRYFSQIIEGEEKTIQSLLQEIKSDQRHHELVVLEEWSIKRRLFRDWALAHAGSFSYFDQIISEPLGDVARGIKPDVRRLVRLMVQLTTAN